MLCRIFSASTTYFVSLEKGFNLPVVVVPRGTKGGDSSRKCRGTGCVVDLNKECPKDVQIVLGNGNDNNNTIAIGCVITEIFTDS